MKRLQNLVLLVWAVALLLFVAFNWQLVQRLVEVNYLFIAFEIRLLMWFILLALAVPLLMRGLSALDVGTYRRRAEKELNVAKAKAYDGLSGEFSRLGDQLKESLEGFIKPESGTSPEPTPPESEPAEKSGKKQKSGSEKA